MELTTTGYLVLYAANALIARRIEPNTTSADEANYLINVCRSVVLNDYFGRALMIVIRRLTMIVLAS